MITPTKLWQVLVGRKSPEVDQELREKPTVREPDMSQPKEETKTGEVVSTQKEAKYANQLPLADLTQEEDKVYALLEEAMQMFECLPMASSEDKADFITGGYPDDVERFRTLISLCQSMIMARLGYRVYNTTSEKEADQEEKNKAI